MFTEYSSLQLEQESKRISAALKTKEVEWHSKFGKTARMTRLASFHRTPILIENFLISFVSSPFCFTF